jgi:hypothetical protein
MTQAVLKRSVWFGGEQLGALPGDQLVEVGAAFRHGGEAAGPTSRSALRRFLSMSLSTPDARRLALGLIGS